MPTPWLSDSTPPEDDQTVEPKSGRDGEVKPKPR
jgi:hypothetical protein